ncbi:MAG: hypothetical protein PWQ77_13 [Kosmotogales bacterium]|nr:hypothetical protein [Kosmotogales bacterium]
MKRTVTLKLGDKEYSFLSNDPDDKVEEVFGLIQNKFDDISEGISKVGFEKTIVFLLVNFASEMVISKKELTRLKNKYQKVVDEMYKKTGEEEK